MSDAEERQLNTKEGSAPQESQKDSPGERFAFRAEQSLIYNSPIVPPEILAQYKRIIPDAPERILAMVERQEAHRHHIEKTVVEAGAKNASKAINVTAYIATLFVGASVFMVYEHFVVYGIVTLGSTLVALAGVNVYGKTTQKSERIEKAKLLTEDDESRQRRRRLAQGAAQRPSEDTPEADSGQQTLEGME